MALNNIYYSLYIRKNFKLIIYKNSIYFLGNLGTLKFKIDNFKKNLPFFKVLKNGKFFLKLSMKSEKVRSFFKIFHKYIYGISFGWFFNLKFKGRGFNIFVYKNLLKFNIGLSHCIFFLIPFSIKIKCTKENIYLYSINFNKIYNLAYKIKKLREIDSYKGKGIYYQNQKIILKAIKKI